MFAEQEALIVARLKDRMPEGTHVGVLDDLERVPEFRQRAPAAWVIYDGYVATARVPTAPAGVAQITQDWFVVLVAKSAKGQGAVDAAKVQASVLALKAIEALLGFHLGGGKYLQISDAPGPEYDAGYCHLPLAFSSAMTVRGIP